MKFIKSFIVASLACLLQACFNSEDYIFDEAETTDIIVEATLAKSMGDFSNITKADTLHISDTIYFLTTVSPSKSIKVQDFHWLMDGKYCSSEYNFKKQIISVCCCEKVRTGSNCRTDIIFPRGFFFQIFFVVNNFIRSEF